MSIQSGGMPHTQRAYPDLKGSNDGLTDQLGSR
jgi:hypothetical protein